VEPAVLNPADVAHLDAMRTATASTLRSVIGDVTDVARLDVPNQRNAGDSLIWAGEVAYFERLALRVRYVADLRSYDPRALRRALPSGVVLIHGGGNLGDLWLGHQRHRERIVADLPDYPIVQLPQSVYFQSSARAEQANAVLGAHPRFRLLARDSLSLQRAGADLPDVDAQFCYDMALGFQPPRADRPRADGRRVLVIARADREQASGLQSTADDWIPGATTARTDWHNSGWEAGWWHALRLAARGHHQLVRGTRRLGLHPAGLPNGLARRILSSINDVNISSALELYSRADVVVVDRLHAHILAALLGIEHVVLDNNYRKISAAYEDYTGTFTTAHYATDVGAARALTIKSLDR
jgi:pyruvyl transferase EpsO